MINIRSVAYSFCALLLTITHHLSAQPTIALKKVSDTEQIATVTFTMKPGDYLYSDYLNISVDHPDITATWQPTTEPITHFDPVFKENKKIFKDSVDVTVHLMHKRIGIEYAHLHCTYYQSTQGTLANDVIKLTFIHPPTPPDVATAIDVEDSSVQEDNSTTPSAELYGSPKHSRLQDFSNYISHLATTTDALWLRLLLVFLLGILLSLTPCNYPMIPITIGILQARGGRSLGANFITSLAYVTGIAITFALLGVLAAFTGQIFGSIMANPLVILMIVALLIYLAFSMLGFYEMYVPRSLSQQHGAVKKGSLFSVFAFGILSGLIASPCLSPGLLLLLSIVTTLGSKLIGFSLLFAFGFGLGLPLLIIGTFSGSLNMLPKAGIWMVEIKKLFGLILLAMCFYFLSIIVSYSLLMAGITLFLFNAGAWYIYDARNSQSITWKIIKNIIGMSMITASVVTAAYTYKSMVTTCAIVPSNWHTNYDKARTLALQENKKLFIDIGAPYCSLCSSIEKTVFTNPVVACVLEKCITLKIDGSDSNNPVTNMLNDRYKVMGFPTYLLINPADGTLIKQWGGEVYTKSHEEFGRELDKELN